MCGDVLEHLREPERFLRRVCRWLGPDGRVVASLPNVRHHTVVSALLEGNWSYEPAGLLDATHLHFFTRRDMVDLFEHAGFHVDELRIVPGSGYDQWRQFGCPGAVQVGRLRIADIPPEEAEEFFVYQYLVVASPTFGTERAKPAGRGAEAAEAVATIGAVGRCESRTAERACGLPFWGISSNPGRRRDMRRTPWSGLDIRCTGFTSMA